LSEEYINRLLRTTIHAKLWEDALSTQQLSLGPKGAFVVLSSESQSLDLILDLLYTGDGKGLQNLFINQNRPIHFPLRIGITPAFELVDSSPLLLFKTGKINSDASEIINGIAEYGLSSKLIVGLKKTIANMILKMGDSLAGKTVFEVNLPALKGSGIENAQFEASAFGRLNLYLKP